MNKKAMLLAAAFLLPMAVSACPGEGVYNARADHNLERLNKELQLSPEQRTKLEAIFKEEHEKFRAYHDEARNRAKEVLTPEQVKKWDAMEEEHRGRHKEMMEKHHPQKP